MGYGFLLASLLNLTLSYKICLTKMFLIIIAWFHKIIKILLHNMLKDTLNFDQKFKKLFSFFALKNKNNFLIFCLKTSALSQIQTSNWPGFKFKTWPNFFFQNFFF